MPNLRPSPGEVKLARPREFHKNLHLLYELVRRDFTLRFTGSALGLAWAVLQPLSLVVLYWFVFTIMIPRGSKPGGEYVLFLISGLLPWLGINEGLIRSTTSIVENAPLVRRLTFRSEILVVVPNITAVLFELIGIGLFLIFLLARGTPLWSLWLLPFAIAIQLMLQIGIGWLLATIYVFFRDLMQFLGFLLSIIFYLSPILYPVEGPYEKFFMWNPMTPLLGLFRGGILGSPLPPAVSIVFLLVLALGSFTAGLSFFRRAQPNIVDLI